jgi:Mg/Co/Ni transporter MgtE
LGSTASHVFFAILAAWAVLAGIGLAWEITAAWIALEIAVVTTALHVGYLSPLLLEGLAIPPS